MTAIFIVFGLGGLLLFTRRQRRFSASGVARVKAKIAAMEPLWAAQDAAEAARLRPLIHQAHQGIRTATPLETLEHQLWLVTQDPDRHEFERDNIRLGKKPGAARYVGDYSPEDLAEMRRLTDARPWSTPAPV